MANATSSWQWDRIKKEKDVSIILINQILFENMTVSGVWLAYLFVLLKRSKLIKANLEFHEKASGTFNEELSKGSAPPPHAH